PIGKIALADVRPASVRGQARLDPGRSALRSFWSLILTDAKLLRQGCHVGTAEKRIARFPAKWTQTTGGHPVQHGVLRHLQDLRCDDRVDEGESLEWGAHV